MRLDFESLLGVAIMGGGRRTAAEILMVLVALAASRIPPRWVEAAVGAVWRGASPGGCTRVVSCRRIRTMWGMKDDGDGSGNALLQRAIMRGINATGMRWPVCHTRFAGCESPPDGEPRSSGSSYFDRFRVFTVPPYDRWVDLGSGVSFRRTSSCHASGDDKEETETYSLRGSHADVDRFVSGCVSGYSRFLRSGDDGRRYVYVPFRRESGIEFKRYPAGEGRGFDTVDMPGKDRVLRMVDHFSRGAGKFAVPGFPRKLGFLLHGPPGTGKTTFAKALASHTSRHVVLVPLDAVQTNQELMSILYDRVYRVGDDTHEVPMSEAVFVMEDVDAVGAAVLDRSRRAAQAPVEVRDGPEEDGRRRRPVPCEDALSLAGVLNALDGALDSPGRIVVMTTNHPEKLDPALVRPGRINMRIEMSDIAPAEALSMIRRYFGEGACLPGDPRLGAFSGGGVSPAALEALCGQHETADGLLAELAARAEPGAEPEAAAVAEAGAEPGAAA